MNSCWASFESYGLRSIGIGEALLPKSGIALCDQLALIGGGLVWNFYFAFLAIAIGFGLALAIALARVSPWAVLRRPANAFIFVFRGSPLFLQFFFAYELFSVLPPLPFSFELGPISLGEQQRFLTKSWSGGLLVLICNTAAYSAEIFSGAYKAVPHTDIEAANAYGMNATQRFQKVIWPSMLRLAWPSYVNEMIFLFHATTLVFIASFPVWQRMGDALYYARYLAEQTFNPFIPYPIVAVYFMLVTLTIIAVTNRISARLNRHLNTAPLTPRWGWATRWWR